MASAWRTRAESRVQLRELGGGKWTVGSGATKAIMTTHDDQQADGDRPRTEGPSTPPLLASKRAHSDDANGKTRAASEGLDSQALHSALKNLQGSGRTDKLHSGSPSRKRQRIYGDRWVLDLAEGIDHSC